MRARLLHLLLALLGRLPLAWLQALGAALGRIWLRRGWREARVARRNLDLCLPALPASAREALLRECLEHSGRALLELAWLWTRPVDEVLARVEAEASVHALLGRDAAGPLIIAAPHLGAWEVLNLWLSQQQPLAILYRAPRSAWVEDLLNRCRGRSGAEPVRAEAAGVRKLVKRLAGGGRVGILPDQQPKLGEGEFADFFGRPALSMSLLPRLAQRCAARVVVAWAERLPQGRGYHLHAFPAEAVHDVQALNAAVERAARELPAQYQWTYKRYTIQPEGLRNPY